MNSSKPLLLIRSFVFVLVLSMGFLLSLPSITGAAEADKVNPEKIIDQATMAYQEHVGPEAKNIISKTYASLDAWRVRIAAQLDEMRAKKAAEYEVLKQQDTQSVVEHAEKVLNGEQKTLYDGSTSRIGFQKIVMRMSVFGLGLLTFVFATRVVFYVILIILILAIIRTIIDRVRRPSLP